MNKKLRLLTLALAAVMLLCCGCNTADNQNPTQNIQAPPTGESQTQPTQGTEGTVPPETIPGGADATRPGETQGPSGGNEPENGRPDATVSPLENTKPTAPDATDSTTAEPDTEDPTTAEPEPTGPIVSGGVVEGTGSGSIEDEEPSSNTGNSGNSDTGSSNTETTTPAEPSGGNDDTAPETTAPTEPEDTVWDITTLTYEMYINMDGVQQQAVISAFGEGQFVKWYNAAKAKYEAEHPDIEIGSDGSVSGGSLGN